LALAEVALMTFITYCVVVERIARSNPIESQTPCFLQVPRRIQQLASSRAVFTAVQILA